MTATVVDTDALWQTVVAAAVAGVGTTFVFSVAIFGFARAADSARRGLSAQATAFAALAVLGIAATLAAVVAGVIVMSSK